jgi:hypothetical protein
MKELMTEATSTTAGPDAAAIDLEQECEAWEWARAAGVSEQELRAAVQQSLGGKQAR